MTDEIPRLRPDIEVIPTSYQGEHVFMVRDALGLIPEPILLQADWILLLRLIDGGRSLSEIQLELTRHHNNVLVGQDTVQAMIRQLDEAMILDSPGYRDARAGIVEEYGRESVRHAHLAGKAYPAERAALESFMEDLMASGDAAGVPPPARKTRALVAPHIDLNVGRRVYARAYGALSGLAPPRIVLLGTGHSLQGFHFSLTDKAFQTPLGEVRSESGWVASLREAGGEAVSPDDFDHRSEHSLEFQLLFCQHLFKEDFTILPVLCGSFHELLDLMPGPTGQETIRGFLTTLKELIESEPDTLVIAGVDFSHIGMKFGHETAAASLLEEAKAHDTALIDALCRGDAAAFWEESRRVGDRYHVCGFSALACLLELFQGLEGHRLDYEFWQEEPTQSAVSFAALLFTQEQGPGSTGG
jgi:AmmeMemoRadiSam system protein B